MYASCIWFRRRGRRMPGHARHGRQRLGAAAAVTSGHTAPQDPHAGHVSPRSHTPGTSGDRGFSTREASGTAWLPDATPMYGFHRTARNLAGHVPRQRVRAVPVRRGRGASRRHQGGSINWFMAMAQASARRRPPGRARHGQSRAVDDSAAAAIPICSPRARPCDGEPIHDRQHPHDLFMELAVEYDVAADRRHEAAVVRRSGGRAGARAGCVSAPALGDAEPDRADRAITGSTPRTSRTESRRLPCSARGGRRKPRCSTVGNQTRTAPTWTWRR